MEIIYREINEKYIDDVKNIYNNLKWNAYLNNDTKLINAFKNSLFVYGAFDNNRLVGFVRVVGDGEHIVLIQDLIVLSEYQKNGIGTNLFKIVWNKYCDVRMFQVVTDAYDEVDNKFYQSFGMKPLIKGDMISYYR